MNYPQNNNNKHTSRGGLRSLLVAGLLPCFLLAGHTALAEDAGNPAGNPDAIDPVIIHQFKAKTILQGEALNSVSGAVGVNMAAGDNNLQSNSGVVAVGDYASTQNDLIQKTIANGFTPDEAQTTIQGQVFSHSVGWMAVNQAAGQGNTQSNSIGVTAGANTGGAISDEYLKQVTSGQQGLAINPENPGNSNQRVEIEGSAFKGSRGIIQVNQSAGTGNATSNSFQLHMELGN